MKDLNEIIKIQRSRRLTPLKRSARKNVLFCFVFCFCFVSLVYSFVCLYVCLFCLLFCFVFVCFVFVVFVCFVLLFCFCICFCFLSPPNVHGGVLSGKVGTGMCGPDRVFFGLSGFPMAPFLFENWFRYRSLFCKMHNFR